MQAEGLDKAGTQDGGIILDSEGRCEDSGYRVEQWMGHRKVMWVVAWSGIISYCLFIYLDSPKESSFRSIKTPTCIIYFISWQP